MDDYLQNIQITIDDEEGPIPGTRNKGLNTIELPKELQDAGSYDPSKIQVDRVEHEMQNAMAHQQVQDN